MYINIIRNLIINTYFYIFFFLQYPKFFTRCIFVVCTYQWEKSEYLLSCPDITSFCVTSVSISNNRTQREREYRVTREYSSMTQEEWVGWGIPRFTNNSVASLAEEKISLVLLDKCLCVVLLARSPPQCPK